MRHRYCCAQLLIPVGLLGLMIQVRADVAPADDVPLVEESAEAAPARISPVDGSAVSTLSPLVSPLLLTPSEVKQSKAQIMRALEQKAGVAIRLAALPNSDRDLRWVEQGYEVAKEPREKYWLVGQHLLMADTLLQSKYTDPRMTGLDIARIASNHIATDLGETRLAAQILQAYLLPNYTLAEESDWEMLSRAGIARSLAQAFQQIEDDPNVPLSEKYKERANLIDAYRLQISVTQDEAKADYARWNIAKALERSFRYEEAIGYLQEVSPTGTQRNARKEIPRLQALWEKQKQDETESAARLAGENPKN